MNVAAIFTSDASSIKLVHRRSPRTDQNERSIRTRTVHVDQSIRVPVNIWIITPHNDGFRTQSLRLSRLVDKLTPPSLHKRNPGVIRIRFVRSPHTDLWATQ